MGENILQKFQNMQEKYSHCFLKLDLWVEKAGVTVDNSVELNVEISSSPLASPAPTISKVGITVEKPDNTINRLNINAHVLD